MSFLSLSGIASAYLSETGNITFQLGEGGCGQLGGIGLRIDETGVSITHPVVIFNPQAFPVEAVQEQPPEYILQCEEPDPEPPILQAAAEAESSAEQEFDYHTLLTVNPEALYCEGQQPSQWYVDSEPLYDSPNKYIKLDPEVFEPTYITEPNPLYEELNNSSLADLLNDFSESL